MPIQIQVASASLGMFNAGRLVMAMVRTAAGVGFSMFLLITMDISYLPNSLNTHTPRPAVSLCRTTS